MKRKYNFLLGAIANTPDFCNVGPCISVREDPSDSRLFNVNRQKVQEENRKTKTKKKGHK